MTTRERLCLAIVAVAIAASIVLGVALARCEARQGQEAAVSEPVIARGGYPSGIYRTSGGAKEVFPSGTEAELESGSVLDAQYGSSVALHTDPYITGTLYANAVAVTDTVSFGATTVTGDTTITGDALISGTTTLSDTLYTIGTATVNAAVVTDTLSVGGVTSMSGAATIGGVATVHDSAYVSDTLTANAGTFTSTLTLESVAFSGPIVFGAEANAVDGVTVTHGLGTTPTVVSVTPFYATALTQTVWVSAVDDTSFTVEIEPGSVTTLTNVYWFAGK